MINIICALKYEARPIVEHFQLAQDGAERPFISYSNRHEGISLTITGVGKKAAAEGTTYVVNRHHPDDSSAWLNIGIAGHKNLAIGTPVLASKIADYSTRQAWIPGIEFPADLNLLPLVTVDKPLDAYPDNDMVDMEASGFFSSAPLGRAHCLKIISDNALNPPHNISKGTIIELVTANITVIEKLLLQLRHCYARATAPTT